MGAKKRAYLVRGSSYSQTGNQTAAASDYLQWLVLTQSRITDLSELKVGKSLVLDMEAGQIYRIPFEAKKGDPIKVTAYAAPNTGADPVILLQDAKGTPIIGDNNGAGGLNAAIPSFVVPADGTYTLLVSHGASSTTGSIDVSLALANPALVTAP